MARQIVFLRGINLRATRRIGMADLRELLESDGYEDVRTHLQSGNVLLSSTLSPRRARGGGGAVARKRFGFDVRVLVRTRAELAKVVERDPLARWRRTAPATSSASSRRSCRRRPRGSSRAAEVAPEQVVVDGREIYSWHPGGQQRSELRKLMRDDRLGVTSTDAELEHRHEAARAGRRVRRRGARRVSAWRSSCARSACGPERRASGPALSSCGSSSNGSWRLRPTP